MLSQSRTLWEHLHRLEGTKGSTLLIVPRFSIAKHVPPACLSPLVQRRRLLAAINAERHKQLLLVHAPAGYGKTVLLSQWRDVVQASGAMSVWISLDKLDGSPGHFLAAFASGLAHAGIPLTHDLAQQQFATEPRARLDALLSAAELSTRETWLTIENWHLVESTPAAEFMELLLRNMPSNWHIALSSRTRPKINLMMLRARGQLVELGLEPLRFSSDETGQLMTTQGLAASAIDELVALTEGWAIALQLANLWLTDEGGLDALRSSFIDSIDGMADFVSAEIFATLAPELKACLLEGSICERFTSELIDFVRDRLDSATLIEALRYPSGFAVAIDGEGEWYRHHRIFNEVLARERRRLQVEHVAQLHSRAALWFEQRGMLFEAVEHARLSGDERRTVQLVEDAGCVDICIRLGAPAVRALLDSLPSDVVRQRPRLRAAFTAMNLKLGSIGQAGELLAELQASVGSDGMDAGLSRDLLLVQNLRECFIDESPSIEDLVLQRRSTETFADADWWLKGLMQNVQGRLEMRRGVLREAVKSLQNAREVFEDGGSAQGHFFMLANLAMCYLFLGKLNTAADYLFQAHAILKRQLGNPTPYEGIVYTIKALLLYERNELAAAGYTAQLALIGLELAEGCFEQYFSAIQVAARVSFASLGLEAAERVIDRGRRLARYHRLCRMDGLLNQLQIRLTIDAQQWDAASRLGPQSAGITGDVTGWLEHDLSTPSSCLLALHEGNPEQALALAHCMAVRCREEGRLPAAIRGHVIEALAASVLENPKHLRDALRQAIELASSDGILQPFFEVEGPMLGLLKDFQRDQGTDLLPAQADFLSGLVLRMIAADKAKAHTAHFTERECQILELLGESGSNKVIARALDLTENAVKFHLKNIFRKLDVDNRAMAAQVGQRLNLGAAR